MLAARLIGSESALAIRLRAVNSGVRFRHESSESLRKVIRNATDRRTNCGHSEGDRTIIFGRRAIKIRRRATRERRVTPPLPFLRRLSSKSELALEQVVDRLR